MKIARVFPRKTKATPRDELAFVGIAPLMAMEDIDEVHVSIAFEYDIDDGEFMAEQLIAKGFNVKVGGPAYGKPGGGISSRYVHERGLRYNIEGMP